MASLVKLLFPKKNILQVGEITGRSGGKYLVDLRSKTVLVRSALEGTLNLGTQVFIIDSEDELKIIAKADVKTRDRKEVIVNG
jgi:hypothetical protein